MNCLDRRRMVLISIVLINILLCFISGIIIICIAGNSGNYSENSGNINSGNSQNNSNYSENSDGVENNSDYIILCLVLFITAGMIFLVIKVDQTIIQVQVNQNQTTANDTFNFKQYKKEYGKRVSTDKNTKCTICIEEIDKDYFCYKSCNHIFHDYCLEEWLQISKICPNCRNEYP